MLIAREDKVEVNTLRSFIRLARRSTSAMLLLALLALTSCSTSQEATSASGPQASDLVDAKSVNITYQEMRFKLCRNLKSDSLILFLHGGPHDESWFLHATVFQRLNVKLWVEGFENESSAWYGFIEYFAGNGFNVLMPYSYYYSDERQPWVNGVASSLMRELHLRHAYIVGYSSGGVVAANAVVGSTIFEKAVIINAALCGHYGKRDDIFSSAYKSSDVAIPHLLVWGANDSITPLIQAQIWMKNADTRLAILTVLEYGHDFRGTPAEDEVRLDILRFLRPDGFLVGFAYLGEAIIVAAIVMLVFQGRLSGRKRSVQSSLISKSLAATRL